MHEPVQDRPLYGILLKVISVLLFIVMSALIKWLDGRVPPGEVVFFRSAGAIPVIMIWLAWRSELKTGVQAQKPLGHLTRGLAGTLSMGLMFAGLAYLPLPDVTAIGYAAPLLTVLFAAAILGERLRAFRMFAVALGLVGVLIVLSPRLSLGGGGRNGEAEAIGATLVLSAAICSALAQVFVRKLVATESTSAIVFWFSITAAVLSLATLPFGWVLPRGTDLALLVGVGLVGGIGQIFLTSSYRQADASLVAPFEYVSMVFALAIGYWVFADVPTATMLGGAALVIFSGLLIIWRERRLGLERAQQRKAMTPQG